VTAATTNGSAVRDVKVNWGDGTSQDLGAITGSQAVYHTYQETGSYTITATLTDASGNVQTTSTAVSVIPVASPTIIITPSLNSCTGSSPNCAVTFTVQVTPPTGVGIISAIINFGDGTASSLGGLNGTQAVPHTYAPNDHQAKTVTVTVVDTLSRTTQGTTVLNLP
jgi:hypothetical protein